MSVRKILNIFVLICIIIFMFTIFEKLNPIKKYPFPEVLDQGYVVKVGERTMNIGYLDEFVEKYSSHANAKVNIIIYSSEGVPVIYSLKTNGEDIILYEDKRRIDSTEFRKKSKYNSIGKVINYVEDDSTKEIENIYYFLYGKEKSRLVYTYIPWKEKKYQSIY